MWQLTDKSKKPIYQKIVALVLGHLKAGRLLPGEKIPPERVLAKELGVNRSTIVHALDELEAMGVVIRRQGSGTTVNDGKWGIYTGGTTNWRNYLADGAFQVREPYLEKLKSAVVKQEPGLIDSFTGELPLELIPPLELPTISWHDFLIEESLVDDLGYLPLRQRIMAKLKKEQGLEIAADQLLLTSGAQQALYLLIQVLLNNGDGIAIEEPSSFYHLSIFQAAGVRFFGVPVDKDGMRVDLLEEKIIRHQIKMVLVNPNFQNPTGTTMSYERRLKLIDLCQQYEIPIIEDDVFSELHFEEKDRPQLLAQLDRENVIYIGSLSKILGATTKIGWVSAPARVTAQLALARQELDFSLSIFPQVLATSALNNPNYQFEIAKLRQELSRRRDYLIQLLEKELAEEVRFVKPLGGYYLWVESRQGDWKREDFEKLLKENILTMPGFLFGADQNSLRLNFARLDEGASQRLVKIMKDVFRA